jgi:hypothetical protein
MSHVTARRSRLRLVVIGAAVVIVLAVMAALAASRNGSDDVPLFVFAGQSNMVAVGADVRDLPAALRKPSPDAVVWDLQARRWVDLEPAAAGNFGPELSALPALARALDRDVVGVKVAVGGTSLATVWDPETTDGLYGLLRDAVIDALSTRPQGKGTPRLAGVFWMQGETDAERQDWGDAYAENLTHLISTLRRDFSDPDLPMVVARIRTDDPRFQLGGAQVRQALDSVSKTTPNTRTVHTDDLRLADTLHFDSGATLTLGRRFASAYLALDDSD